MLYVGIEECQVHAKGIAIISNFNSSLTFVFLKQVANDAMKYLSPIKTNDVPPYHTFCNLLNTSVCNVSQSFDNVYSILIYGSIIIYNITLAFNLVYCYNT